MPDRAAIIVGTLAALFVTTLLLGARLRRIGAASPGRMLHLRFPGREGLPLRILLGLAASVVLAGLLHRILGLLTMRIETETGLGPSISIVLAALLVFLPGWAGGITTVLRLARIGLAFGFAAIVTAILIGELMPASAEPCTAEAGPVARSLGCSDGRWCPLRLRRRISAARAPATARQSFHSPLLAAARRMVRATRSRRDHRHGLGGGGRFGDRGSGNGRAGGKRNGARAG